MAPDEPNQLFRAWQISEGKILPEKYESRLGGSVPINLTRLALPFIYKRWDPAHKTSAKDIKATLSLPLNPEDQMYVDFPNTALYTPVAYLPQAFMLFLCRIFEPPALIVLYLSRLGGLIFWMCCVHCSIRWLPAFKWLFVFLALLPMSVFIHSAVSADIVTNSLAFLFVALTMKLAFSREPVSGGNLISIVLLGIFLAMSKSVYVPLVLLVFIIPRKNFVAVSTYYFGVVTAILLPALTLFFISKITAAQYIPFSEYNIESRDDAALGKGANMHEQLDFIVGQPVYFTKLVYKAVFTDARNYVVGYIGLLGWLDTRLPQWLIISSYLMIFLLCLADSPAGLKLSARIRLLLVVAFTSSLLLLLISQYLTWSRVGSDFIAVQGRYFIAIAPLLFLAVSYPGSRLANAVPLSVVGFSFLSLSFTLFIILQRYYFI